MQDVPLNRYVCAMSYLTVITIQYTTEAGTIIRDLWPEELPQLHTEDITQVHGLTHRDIVPDTLDKLIEWGYVGRHIGNTDRSRRHLLCHKQLASDMEVPVQVAIRLQGFVRKLNLHPTGTWSTYIPHLYLHPYHCC